MVVNLAGLEAAAKPLKGSSMKLLYYGTVFLLPCLSLLFGFFFYFMMIYIPRESAGVGIGKICLLTTYIPVGHSKQNQLVNEFNSSFSFSV
jgi:hypothetical protein